MVRLDSILYGRKSLFSAIISLGQFAHLSMCFFFSQTASLT